MYRTLALIAALLLLLPGMWGEGWGGNSTRKADKAGNATAARQEAVLLRGRILSISRERREVRLHCGRIHGPVVVVVDDPKRLEGLEVGMRVVIEAEGGHGANATYRAREIVAPGWRCMCDPTGVRGRMRRGWRRWGCGGGCCDRR